MAIQGDLVDRTSLEGLYVGADHVIDVVIYSDTDLTTIIDTSSWTLVTLDFRKSDLAAATVLSVNGTRSGTFNADPDVNTEKWSFTLSDDQLAATVFTGDDPTSRYSIWRKDAGSEQPVRFGTATFGRTTQT